MRVSNQTIDVRCFAQVSLMSSADWLERFGFKHVFLPGKKISHSGRPQYPIIPMIRLPKSSKNVQEAQLGTILHASSGKLNTNFAQIPVENKTEPKRNERQVQLQTLRKHSSPQLGASGGGGPKPAKPRPIPGALSEKTAEPSMGYLQTATETLSLDAIRAQLAAASGAGAARATEASGTENK